MGVFSRGRLCVWEARAGSMTRSTSDGDAIILPCNPLRGILIYCVNRFLRRPLARAVIKQWRASGSANGKGWA